MDQQKRPTMDEIITWGAVETAANIRAKSISVTEVTKAHLARIAQTEPDLNAVVEVLGDSALKTAALMDANRPTDPGPLFGVPVTIKVNVDFAGRPNNNGLPALNQKPADEDAPLVASLRRDGAIPIGRTNVPEFSLRWFTSNPLYGVTKYSVNAASTPGGSSGGAASSLAAGVGVLAHGNDLGGSLRYPAYCCGLATLRPSMGRVPAFNPSAAAERPATLQMMSVQGMLARNVADVRLAMGTLSKRSALDPLWNGATDSGRKHAKRLKIGVSVDPFGDGVAPKVAAGVAIATAALKSAGHEIVEITPPMAAEAAIAWGQLMNAETYVMAMDSMKPIASDQVLAVLDDYKDYFGLPDLKGFMQQQAMRMHIQRAWSVMFDQIDALILPVSAAEPFRLEQDFAEPETRPAIMKAQRMMVLANVLGLPAASVPTGMNDGVPMGVQIMGAWRDDDLCLDVAQIIETELGLNLTPITP